MTTKPEQSPAHKAAFEVMVEQTNKLAASLRFNPDGSIRTMNDTPTMIHNLVRGAAEITNTYVRTLDPDRAGWVRRDAQFFLGIVNAIVTELTDALDPNPFEKLLTILSDKSPLNAQSKPTSTDSFPSA